MDGGREGGRGWGSSHTQRKALEAKRLAQLVWEGEKEGTEQKNSRGREGRLWIPSGHTVALLVREGWMVG
jgi:biotin-(acetyl-CoA carboxylase) ligase